MAQNQKQTFRTKFLFAYKKMMVWGGYLFFTIIIIINLMWIFTESGTNDYGSFYDSGKAFLAGENPYADTYPNIFRPILNGTPVPSPNLNPPISVYLFSLFALIDLHLGYRLWQILSFILYIIGLILLKNVYNAPTSVIKWFWTFSVAGLWHAIQLGQIYVLLFIFIVFAYINIGKSNEIAAGLFLGMLIAIKPNFAILLALLFIARFYKIALAALFTVVISLTLPLILNGGGIYANWFEATTLFNGTENPGNSTIIGFFSGFGLQWIGWLFSFICLAALALFVYRKRLGILTVLAVGLVASILFSPISWPGYMLVLVPSLLLRKWGKVDYVISFAFCLPIIIFHAIINFLGTTSPVWGRWFGFSFLSFFIRNICIAKQCNNNASMGTKDLIVG